MGTDVFWMQEYLIRQGRLTPEVFSRRRCGYGGNPRPNRRPGHKKRSNCTDQAAMISKMKLSSENLLSEKVTILRRGESLDSKIKSELLNQEMMVCGIDRIGPDPEMVPKQIRIGDGRSLFSQSMYAGSAFSLSPEPSSLPFPSFYKKHADESATKDLRRLLRLD